MFPMNGMSNATSTRPRRKVVRFAIGSLLALAALVAGASVPASAQTLAPTQLDTSGGGSCYIYPGSNLHCL